MPESRREGNLAASEYSYDLSLEFSHCSTTRLLKYLAPRIPEDSGFITVELLGDDEFSDLARDIERRVFETFFGNDAQEMAQEYGPYEQSSRFFLFIDCMNKQPVGALRVISNSNRGLKTLNDAQGKPFNVKIKDVACQHSINDLDKAWDVGTVAVLPEYRSTNGLASIQLYRAMYISALKNQVDHLFAVVDDKPLQLLRDFLGIPFIPLAGSNSGPYLGSDMSHAVYGYIPEFYEKMSIYMRGVENPMLKAALDRLVNGTEDDMILLIQ